MESSHKSNAHRDIAAASLASLTATLAAIRAHTGDVHQDAQTSSSKHADQNESNLDADGDYAPPMRRLMS